MVLIEVNKMKATVVSHYTSQTEKFLCRSCNLKYLGPIRFQVPITRIISRRKWWITLNFVMVNFARVTKNLGSHFLVLCSQMSSGFPKWASKLEIKILWLLTKFLFCPLIFFLFWSSNYISGVNDFCQMLPP